MADASVALDLTNILTMALTGGTSLIVLNVRSALKDAKKMAEDAQEEARRGRKEVAAKMEALVARWEDKRTSCQAEADGRYARKEDLTAHKASTSQNFAVIYGRLRDAEVAATEARAFAGGVEKTVSALCGGNEK